MKINHVLAKAALGLCIGVASLTVSAQSMKVTLSGSQEVPPVMTSASGVGSIMVAPDGSLSGTITTTAVTTTT